jgi:hypothetical protein
MQKINIKAHVLKLNGHKKTLFLAHAHNTRVTSKRLFGYGKIDPELTHLNIELVSCDESFEDKAIEIVKKTVSDFDTNKKYRNSNRGFAVEFVFTVSAGFNCDFYAFYIDCLEWLKSYLPNCPIVHAVIHFDEGIPHMHVIIVPFLDGRLQASKVSGYIATSTERNISVFNYLGKKYGLTYPMYLRGAAKRTGIKLAIEAYNSLSHEEAIKVLSQTVIPSIYNNPEVFLHALDIGYEKVFGGSQKQL